MVASGSYCFWTDEQWYEKFVIIPSLFKVNETRSLRTWPCNSCSREVFVRFCKYDVIVASVRVQSRVPGFKEKSLVVIWLETNNLDICKVHVACVAGGISCASACVLVAKSWTQVVKPWEDWWRVELNFTRGIAASEYPRQQSPQGNMAAPPLARSRIPPATQAKQGHKFPFLTQ